MTNSCRNLYNPRGFTSMFTCNCICQKQRPLKCTRSSTRFVSNSEEYQLLTIISAVTLRLNNVNICRVKQLFQYNFLTNEEVMANPWKSPILSECLSMYDCSMATKSALNTGVRYTCCNNDNAVGPSTVFIIISIFQSY